MKWITHTHIHVDRGACPWLIQRFIDAQAEFLFVAKDIVLEIAEKEDAIPYDMPGVELGHKDGHCSFVSIMKKYRITDPAVLKIADIVNATDTHAMDTNAYAPGLEAIVSGFSLLFPDDHMNFEQQFILYDALYAIFKSQP
ncbi:MAG TPA: chromate resistance protein [Candidatus Cloacimonadota bacterium]|nr:chromate resistance protein [Candidatus Cloacimonadota bacterium]HPT71420.1 chromate resistance protein [Candidatus Cloacimonadota bacterium]